MLKQATDPIKTSLVLHALMCLCAHLCVQLVLCNFMGLCDHHHSQDKEDLHHLKIPHWKI